MRALLIIGVLVCGTVSLFGQGRIDFNNAGASAEQKVYIDEWLDPSALAPGGGQFLVALYFAPVEAGEANLTQVGAPGTFGTDPGWRSGLFFGGVRTVATATAGGPGIFQVRGWEAAYGTYEEAAAKAGARLGQSPLFIADTANPNTLEVALNLIASSAPDRPYRGFVIAVPEPTTGVLISAGVGAAIVVIRAKRRRG